MAGLLSRSAHCKPLVETGQAPVTTSDRCLKLSKMIVIKKIGKAILKEIRYADIVYLDHSQASLQ